MQLQAFLAAATCGTFTAAAEELGMSQPAISDLIRRLEGELGAKLFVRGSRTLNLTSAGEQLLPHAEQAVASAALGAQAVRLQVELGGGTATFGLLRNADFYLNADLAKRFRTRYPNVRVRLVGQNSAETASNIANGVLEAGLVTLPIDDTGMDVLPIARDEVVFVTSDGSRARRRISIGAFAAGPLVLYDAHYATTDPARRQLNDRAQLVGERIDPVVEVEYLTTALSLVEEGFGDSIVCRAATKSTIMPDDLYTASFEEPMFDTLAFVKRRGQVLSPATRELVRLAWDALCAYQDTPHGTAEILVEPEDVQSFLER
ncbi:LysR family transcriptional regulator [Agromyces bracchium]|uniref:LysR family transcriptional regulator n=3 Tax=Agromyces bracchium TaxID=88376 RepID=A0A6I3M6W3_9MICO|nr:LysR family transcriptional regulator [Agromyces bracchium]MTH70400.1 LysR family transcriptional regulator [Agromyces bracchium]